MRVGFELAEGVPETVATWCSGLPAALAAAPREHDLHRARNRLVRLELPGGEAVVVKHFGTTLSGLLTNPLRGSKARRSFAIACELQRRKVPTPAPVAWVEWRRGPGVTAAAYVSRDVPAAQQLRRWLRGDGENYQVVLGAAGRAIADGHRAGVRHRDLSPGNLICSAHPEDPADWRLVDLNRVRFAAVADAASGAALLARLVAREPARGEALLAGYAAGWGADPITVRSAWALAHQRWLRASWLKRSTRGLRRSLSGRRA